jgi:hypothetical protein
MKICVDTALKNGQEVYPALVCPDNTFIFFAKQKKIITDFKKKLYICRIFYRTEMTQVRTYRPFPIAHRLLTSVSAKYSLPVNRHLKSAGKHGCDRKNHTGDEIQKPFFETHNSFF